MSLPPIHSLLEPLVGKFLFSNDVTSADLAESIKTLLNTQLQSNTSAATFSEILTKIAYSGFDLINYESKDSKCKIAGLTVFDCMLDINDDISPGRRIEIVHFLRKVLDNDKIPLDTNGPVLRFAASIIGHFARVGSTIEVEVLQNFHVPLVSRLLKDIKSDCHKFAGALLMTQLSLNSPALIFSRRKELFASIWDVVSDKNYVVREVAAEALETGLKLLSQRSNEATEEYLKQALRQIDIGFIAGNSVEKANGGLMIFDILLQGVIVSSTELQVKMKEQGLSFEDMIWKVLQKKDSKDADIRKKVIDIIPNLAKTFSNTFLLSNEYTNQSSFLQFTVKYLLDLVKGKKVAYDRPLAYIALGKLVVAMATYLRSQPAFMNDIMVSINDGFRDPFCVQALQCMGMVINTIPSTRKSINTEFIDSMFRGGITSDLIETLKVIHKHIPPIRNYVENQLVNNIRSVLLQYAVLTDETQKNLPRELVGSTSKPTNKGVTKDKGVTKETTSSNSNIFSLGGNSSPSQKSSPIKHYTWAGIFSTLAPVSLSSQSTNASEHIILVLKILSSKDFFQKKSRDNSNPEGVEVGIKLLGVVKEAVIRYFVDFNPAIRAAACHTSLVVLDTVVMLIDSSSEYFVNMIEIIDRVLLIGAGDEVPEIRITIFDKIAPSFDHIVASSQHIQFLIYNLDDENIDVRVAAMLVLSRVAQYDLMHIVPVLALHLQRLLKQLQAATDGNIPLESVKILQALVKGSSNWILPYAKLILMPLIALLENSSSDIVGSALSTIGELAVTTPEIVREYHNIIFPNLIVALNDDTSIRLQEIAVIVLGKLVSSLTMITEEPYLTYPGLFEGLVHIIQTSDDAATDLKLQSIRTAGLLGAVEIGVYQRHLRSLAGAMDSYMPNENQMIADSEDNNKINQTKKEESSKMEKYYFNVVIRELINILKDVNQAMHHQETAAVAVKVTCIFQASQSPNIVFQLVETIIHRIYSSESGTNLRDNLFNHLVSLIREIGYPITTFEDVIIKVVCGFFDSHLQQCLDIVEAMASVYPAQEFADILRKLIPLMVKVMKEEACAEQIVFNDGASSKGSDKPNDSFSRTPATSQNTPQTKKKLPRTGKIVQTIGAMSTFLGKHFQMLVSNLTQIMLDEDVNIDLRKNALIVTMMIGKGSDLNEFESRIVHPLIRLLNSPEQSVQLLTVSALCTLLHCMKEDYLPYIIPVRRKMSTIIQFIPQIGSLRPPQVEEYEYLVNRLLKQRPLPSELSNNGLLFRPTEPRKRGSIFKSTLGGDKLTVNWQALETAWALAGHNSSKDLTSWLRRLSVELIRQSPSQIIRPCATLAKAYPHLAEQLLNISFFCVWDERFSSTSDISDSYQVINGIEMALQNPQIPMKLRHTLLNLVEFMDMQNKRLPLDVQVLAQRAEAANMFAKCLRYRELQYNSTNILPSNECIEALILVNNELGLPDRAAGVLQHVVETYSHVEIQPLWLEKLSRWDDAYSSYKHRNQRWIENYGSDRGSKKITAEWMQSELGILRCLRALGEYDTLEENAKELKGFFRSEDHMEEHNMWMSEVQQMGSNAAWLLGHWDTMSAFLEEDIVENAHDVELINNTSFYKAILAIHNQNYNQAMAYISTTRSGLSNIFGSLLSENYSRAYRAMISMQILSEMEEVVEFKEMTKSSTIDLDHIANTPIKIGGVTVAAFVNDGVTEVVPDKKARGKDIATAKRALLRKWRGRLKWAPRDVEVFRQILAVRTLVAEPTDDLDNWLEMVTLCRKEGKFSLCENLLRQLGAPLPPKKQKVVIDRIERISDGGDVEIANFTEGRPIEDTANADSEQVIASVKPIHHRVLLGTFKYWWASGEKKKAISELTNFLQNVDVSTSDTFNESESRLFRVQCLLKRAQWMRELDDNPLNEVLDVVKEAKDLAPEHYAVWHAWAVTNYAYLKKADVKETTKDQADNKPSNVDMAADLGISIHPVEDNFVQKRIREINLQKRNNVATLSNANLAIAGSASLANLVTIKQGDDLVTNAYIVNAITGFVKSIILSTGQPMASILQDTLRLLTLWFTYGTKEGIGHILKIELDRISPDTWLSVIPQLIARMHIKNLEITGLLRKILIKLARFHPQALVCPISVSLNTNDNQQKKLASEVINEMRKKRSNLVDEATTVSNELMRVAMTPHEIWHDGLEKAASYYLESKDIASMLHTLLELHDSMNDSTKDKKNDGFSSEMQKVGTSSLRDISFRHSYELQLQEAQKWLELFKSNGRTMDLHQAWEIYQQIFRRLQAQILNFKKAKLEMLHVSPSLTNAKNLELVVPGTYSTVGEVIGISAFSHSITVIPSKQRPRRISILGSDGIYYPFLLKGKEDLRQDERVMQLFGLINVCLEDDRRTKNRGLPIVRYSVLPLSNNSGVIGWVENCDTINSLILNYRESNQMNQNIERKMIQSKSPLIKRSSDQWMGYYKLPLIQKIDVFKQVTEETTGQDFAKILWEKSRTSDAWVERRANLSKSIAVMSMVGYILGLGDRHPSNLMVDRITGRVIHIDFGDCFEVTAKRRICPEVVPFRLTRMMEIAMEASGIQGTFRLNCERTMSVIRDNHDSVMAMLEAFVYDPLISWRLLANENINMNEGLNNTIYTDTTAQSPKTALGDVDLLNTTLGLGIDLDTGLVTNHGDVRESFGNVKDALTLLSNSLSSGPIAQSIQNSNSMSFHREAVSRRKSIDLSLGDDPPNEENLNARALEVITRIQAKLSGKDFKKFDDDDDLNVEQQVNRLIKEATSIENLCQLYMGWCATW